MEEHEVDFGFEVRLASEHTGGALAIVEHPIAPGILAAPVHTHSREDECSYVVAGRIGALIGDRELEAGPGDVIWKPRGVPHAFWNPGPERALVLELIVPGGFERFFAGLGPILTAGPPDLAALGELAGRFGLQYDFASIPTLLARGLRPPGP
ncbi:MAG: cupin domain-containing protein [Candidatus Dormibacteraeota bacterium]|nr:cupin domain-containing protein [Candidatus Dormibacteraeota bacterium]MDQ6920370.1 cupin domain-containing protein [Candidatus Dormibacteraeota bacterium]